MPHYRIAGINEIPILVQAESLKEATEKFLNSYPDAKYILIFSDAFGKVIKVKS